MSDFIYSSISKHIGDLTRNIQSIYQNDPPEVSEYHGDWGSLGVSRNLYNGFQPMETETHIFVIIGGPVLCFRDNLFLTGNNPVDGTKSIYERWQLGKIQWDEDLSGPFVIFMVDKVSKKLSFVTDLMMFIPVYKYRQNGNLTIGTHIDALANANEQTQEIDLVSICDFILNDTVTYPYTAYKNIHQGHPATVHEYEMSNQKKWQEKGISIYWLPKETNSWVNIKEAANSLRDGLHEYVNQVTEGMTHVAQFLSAGEDSRALAGLLPQRLRRDAYIFLDSMNREGQIAQKVANAYGATFYPQYRNKTHYLDILPEASDLVGSGHQYKHAHSLSFHKTCCLYKYSAVFGGFLSDTLLKGHHVKKIKSHEKLPFLPQIKKKQYTPVDSRMKNGKKLFDVYDRVLYRRTSHLSYISSIRPHTASEWFNMWPLSMHNDIPNIYSNRRLFRSYEIFTCKESVKVAASVPTNWKLNRTMFNIAARPLFKRSRWTFHADGRLPYFPWWVNVPIHFYVWLYRQFGVRTGLIKGNQGAWGDWTQVMNDRKWKNTFFEYNAGLESILDTVAKDSVEKMFFGNILSRTQKVNLLQTLHFLTKGDKCVSIRDLNRNNKISSPCNE